MNSLQSGKIKQKSLKVSKAAVFGRMLLWKCNYDYYSLVLQQRQRGSRPSCSVFGVVLL